MPKVNVYLPDNMAAEVKAAQLSLSPICQRAIREELDRVSAIKAASKDLRAVAERLRNTIDEEDRGMRQEGYNDGVAWAREYATADELQYVAQDFDPDRDRFDGDHSIVAFVAARDGENVISVGAEPGPYWDGFADGAREVFGQVRPLL